MTLPFGRQVSREIKPDVEIKEEDEEELEEVAKKLQRRVTESKTRKKRSTTTKTLAMFFFGGGALTIFVYMLNFGGNFGRIFMNLTGLVVALSL